MLRHVRVVSHRVNVRHDSFDMCVANLVGVYECDAIINVVTKIIITPLHLNYPIGQFVELWDAQPDPAAGGTL